jgi:hypothetical protein
MGGHAMPQTVGTPRRYLQGWIVTSSTGLMEYYVRREHGRWVCQCPSHRWRKIGICKHIVAVRKEVAMG